MPWSCHFDVGIFSWSLSTHEAAVYLGLPMISCNLGGVKVGRERASRAQKKETEQPHLRNNLESAEKKNRLVVENFLTFRICYLTLSLEGDQWWSPTSAPSPNRAQRLCWCFTVLDPLPLWSPQSLAPGFFFFLEEGGDIG